MNYKLKSLIYLFAFILSVLLYNQMEENTGSQTLKHSKEITMNGTYDLSAQKNLL